MPKKIKIGIYAYIVVFIAMVVIAAYVPGADKYLVPVVGVMMGIPLYGFLFLAILSGVGGASSGAIGKVVSGVAGGGGVKILLYLFLWPVMIVWWILKLIGKLFVLLGIFLGIEQILGGGK